MKRHNNFEVKKFVLYPEKGTTGAAFLRGVRGCYVIYLNEYKKENILYVGKATNDLENVITRHFQKGNYSQVKFKQYTENPEIKYLCKVFITGTATDTENLERYLMEKYSPQLNIKFPASVKSLTRFKARQRWEINNEIEKKLKRATGEVDEDFIFDPSKVGEDLPF